MHFKRNWVNGLGDTEKNAFWVDKGIFFRRAVGFNSLTTIRASKTIVRSWKSQNVVT